MSLNPYTAAIGAVVDLGSQVAAKVQQGRSRQAHGASVSPLDGGQVVTATFSGAGQQRVEHLLSRVPTGWVVVGKNASCDVWSYGDADARFLLLEADAAATLTLLVF